MKNNLFCFLILFLFLSGCATPPGVRNPYLSFSKDGSSLWKNYEEAVVNYNKIKIGMTKEELKELGIVDGGLNIKVVGWAEISKLIPRYKIKNGDLDLGILDFLNTKVSRRKAFEIDVLVKQKHQEGNFFTSISNFYKFSRVTGYKIKYTILLVDDKVTYVFDQTGQNLSRPTEVVKPLGPLDSDSLKETSAEVLGNAI